MQISSSVIRCINFFITYLWVLVPLHKFKVVEITLSMPQSMVFFFPRFNGVFRIPNPFNQSCGLYRRLTNPTVTNPKSSKFTGGLPYSFKVQGMLLQGLGLVTLAEYMYVNPFLYKIVETLFCFALLWSKSLCFGADNNVCGNKRFWSGGIYYNYHEMFNISAQNNNFIILKIPFQKRKYLKIF